MTNEDFVNKLLNGNFEALSVIELILILDNYEVFKLGKEALEFSSKVKELVKDSLLKEIEDEELRLSVMRLLYDKLSDRFFVLNVLDTNRIANEQLIVDYKSDLFEKLYKLDSYKLCTFIDKIGYYNDDYKLYFMGNLGKIQRAYHNINMVVSETYGATVAFDVFGKKNAKVWQRLNYEDFNRGKLIECLKSCLVHHFYILDGIANVLINESKDTFEKPKTLAVRMTKSIKIYRDIIDEEKAKLKKTGKKFEQSWIYSSDGLGMEAIDGE